jgi:hypothetical protein
MVNGPSEISAFLLLTLREGWEIVRKLESPDQGRYRYGQSSVRRSLTGVRDERTLVG